MYALKNQLPRYWWIWILRDWRMNFTSLTIHVNSRQSLANPNGNAWNSGRFGCSHDTEVLGFFVYQYMGVRICEVYWDQPLFFWKRISDYFCCLNFEHWDEQILFRTLRSITGCHFLPGFGTRNIHKTRSGAILGLINRIIFYHLLLVFHSVYLFGF